ncbi:ribonuclease E, partial [Citrobacter freundii]|nr:ribonuclease E [Citrobacter freundii]
RDERYPLQSPMPLTVACASPEMASGKVWIRYPVARSQDAQPEAQEIEQVQAQPVVTEPQAVVAAVETVAVVEPAVETVAEAVAEAPVQADVVVETTHPEVIATPVVEQPQVIADADVPVAEDVAAQAEPVAETQETAPVMEETPEVVAPEPETVAVEPEVVAAEPVAVEPEVVVAKPEVVTEPVEAPVVVEAPTAPAPVAEPVVDVAPVAETAASIPAEPVAEHSHATAPMTRAPAPEYVPEAPRQSEWQRPAFAFDGKGAAGGHSATQHASAGPTRPQPVE